VPNGDVSLALGDAKATQTLSEGRYTAIAWPSGNSVKLSVFRDGSAAPGSAKLRAIHVAGELGKGDVMLDGQAVVHSLAPGSASDYLTEDPGTYDLQITRPGGGGSPLAEKSGVSLAAGTVSSAIVMGSGGQPLEVVLATDSVAAPSGGPATGLGGLDGGGPPWVAAMLAALCAGTLGGAAFRLVRRRGA
jgi:hypothetical protein